MLDFANRPPTAPEDVSFSDVGELLLKRSVGFDRASATYGAAALSEVVDALGEEISPDTLNEVAGPYARHLSKLAHDIIVIDSEAPSHGYLRDQYIERQRSWGDFRSGLGFFWDRTRKGRYHPCMGYDIREALRNRDLQEKVAE